MPPNDPQWGKKNNEGPPDLHEILGKAQQQIARLLGFRSRVPAPPGGGSGGGGGNMNAAIGGGVVAVILLIVAVWLASGFYIVDEGRRGVVLRLGKYLETTMPGPRWHVPYPFESVEVVNVAQVRTVEVGYRGTPKNKQPQEALMLTDDENIVDVQFAVQYTLKSPEDYLFNNRNPDDNVLQAAETAIGHRRAVPLEAMNALERKVIHEHLKGRHDVETYSEGQEPSRRLVVAPLVD